MGISDGRLLIHGWAIEVYMYSDVYVREIKAYSCRRSYCRCWP